MFIDYLIGLGIFVGIILYIFLFNFGWYVITKESCDDPIGFVILPFLIPMAIIAVLTIPLLLAKAFL